MLGQSRCNSMSFAPGFSIFVLRNEIKSTFSLSHRSVILCMVTWSESWAAMTQSCQEWPRNVNNRHAFWPRPARMFTMLRWTGFNTLRPRQNGRHYPDDTLKCIFLYENVQISIKISLKFVPKGQVDNNPALVQIMAWHRIGDKPLSEPKVTQFYDAHMRHAVSMI